MKTNYPEYVETKSGEKYKINTSYKIALEIEEIYNDETICDEEKTLAILFLLFGEKGIESIDDWQELSDLAQIYLSYGNNDSIPEDSKKIDLDYLQDISAIRMSFLSDYNIDLEKEDMHLYKFIEGISNLTEYSSLNRIRELRNFDVSKIKDEKTKSEIIAAKKKVAIKHKTKIEKTEEEREIDEMLINLLT